MHFYSGRTSSGRAFYLLSRRSTRWLGTQWTCRLSSGFFLSGRTFGAFAQGRRGLPPTSRSLSRERHPSSAPGFFNPFLSPPPPSGLSLRDLARSALSARTKCSWFAVDACQTIVTLEGQARHDSGIISRGILMRSRATGCFNSRPP